MLVSFGDNHNRTRKSLSCGYLLSGKNELLSLSVTVQVGAIERFWKSGQTRQWKQTKRLNDKLTNLLGSCKRYLCRHHSVSDILTQLTSLLSPHNPCTFLLCTNMTSILWPFSKASPSLNCGTAHSTGYVVYRWYLALRVGYFNENVNLMDFLPLGRPVKGRTMHGRVGVLYEVVWLAICCEYLPIDWNGLTDWLMDRRTDGLTNRWTDWLCFSVTSSFVKKS